MEPNYAPNVVNQTVDFGGFRWKGNPGQSWQKVGATGSPGGDNQGFNASGQMTDPVTIASALQKQTAANNAPAISTLTTQKDSLTDQYKKLLDSVSAQGSATYDTAVSGENAFLGARGLLSQAGKGNAEMSQAENTVNTSNAVNFGNVETAASNAITPITQAIAGLQSGSPEAAIGAGANYANVGQQGQLLPSQIALNLGQANQSRYITIPNIGVYDTTSGKIISSTGLSSTGRTVVGQY